jgi:hypothetical protein
MHHKHLSWLFERQSYCVHAMAIAKSAAGEIQVSRPMARVEKASKVSTGKPSGRFLGSNSGGISKLVKQKKEKGDYLMLTVVRP